jgi:hypothetical protein
MLAARQRDNANRKTELLSATGNLHHNLAAGHRIKTGNSERYRQLSLVPLDDLLNF